MLMLSLRWSVGCDDDGSSSSYSALMRSHVALEANPGETNPPTGRAGMSSIFLCHVLVLKLVTSHSSTSRAFSAFFFILSCSNEAAGAPTSPVT